MERRKSSIKYKLLLCGILLTIGIATFANLELILFYLHPEDPTENAAFLLRDAYRNLGVLFTAEVRFRNGYEMDSASIVTKSKVAIKPDQLCLSLGDFKDETSSWEQEATSSIRYFGGAAKRTKLYVLCDLGDMLSETMARQTEAKLDIVWISNCSCIFGKRKICCLIALGKLQPNKT